MAIRILMLPGADASESRAALADIVHATVVVVDSVGALFTALGASSWDVTLLSLSASNVDEAVVHRVTNAPETGAVLLTTPSVTFTATLIAQRAGALGILREPLDGAQLRDHLAELSSDGPSVTLPAPPESIELVGESPAMTEAFGAMARVAASDSTVLVTGESGTGKEVVARAIHEESRRAGGPFVAINCAAIPEQLLESELFGHEKGAFTGAVGRRQGRFERAHGGTLFLDEIGDMSLVLQAKLLRALEERAIERVGGDGVVPIDVRVVAATNQELGAAIEEGSFREDLFYRLAVVRIDLPPLRERAGDVRRLALYFAAHFARIHDRPIRAISERALTQLDSEAWHGNVRELRNAMDRAVLMTHGEVIRARALRLGAAVPRASARSRSGGAEIGYPAETPLEAVEADHIRRTLESVGWQMGRAADLLGIHRNTLTRKVREYGLAEPDA